MHTTTAPGPTALIAEDEPLLAQALQQELAQAWPALRVLATVGDGLSAVRESLALAPDVLFFDIRMPGQSGLDAAAELVDAWPSARPFPALVFLTAYDQYAVQAFEAQALDYLLKPLQPERLRKTVARCQALLESRAVDTATAASTPPEALLAQLRQWLGAGLPAPAAPAPPASGAAVAEPLRFIQAGTGARIDLVPLAEVLVLEAADKYVRVLTAGREHLIRTPLRELAGRLDPAEWWQIHRGTLVRASAIESVQRGESGRLHVQLRGLGERFAVSRVYAQQFRAM